MHAIRKRFDTSQKILLFSLVVFLVLRFPSLFEPYWYGDEGIYQIIGIALHKGRELYTGIWDNKPPLLYIMYMFTQGSQFLTRLISLFVGFLTVILFFVFSKKLFQKNVVVGITTVLFAVLLGSPYIEGNIANAENFMLLPITLGMLLSYTFLAKKQDHTNPFIRTHPRLSLFVAGLMFGVAFSLKIVGIFEYASVLSFLFLTHPTFSDLFKKSLTLTAGFIIPFLLFTGYFILAGSLFPYIQSILFVNISYVGYENYFLIPQGLLVFKLFVLILFLLILYRYQRKMSYGIAFVLIWLGFSLFSSLFSHRSYTHYLLLPLPPLILLGGYVLTSWRRYALYTLGYVVLLVFLFVHFKPYGLIKTALYYENFISFITGNKETVAYQTFFDKDVPRDYAIASYLDMKLKTDEEVFIWGNNAQIYALSNTLPVGRFTVAYHINTPELARETQEAINTQKPRYVVVVNDVRIENLSLSDYTYRMTLDNTTIYERTF